jgi:hypothetical protein
MGHPPEPVQEDHDCNDFSCIPSLPQHVRQPLTQDFIKLVYSLEIQYTFIVHLTKLSILYFYVQFFPAGFFPKLRRVFSVTATATVVSCISFSMAFIFQCTPANLLWDAFSEDLPLDVRASGYCINTYAFGWAASSINLAFDLWLLVLPMPELYRLSLPRSKKLAVCAMFAMGSL